ncbi:MAG: AmmeMemoRadiSam system radical SAM enzyme [Myxococcota bacterium]|nr:AmmeMemoRadiSam system radical SAM enzyme [Myxococcota bacterium]
MSRREAIAALLATAAAQTLVPGRVLGADPSPHLAEYWESVGDGAVKCLLCPRGCLTKPGERGLCRVRENRGGQYYSLVYGRPVALHVDPIEKKPLFHYRPGCQAYSLATAGCNLQCRFCQNWEISQSNPEDLRSTGLLPEQAVTEAKSAGARAIAFTYNEPTVFYEFARDTAKATAGSDIGAVMISNGFIREKPLKGLIPHLAAYKIDFKSFAEGFYSDVCSAHLRPVLDTMQRIHDAGLWLEVVMLVIPTLNDDPKMLEVMSRWIFQKLGPDVPVHYTRFHPMYKIQNLPPTPVKTLEQARTIAMNAGVRYAYAGNVPGHPGENTYCPSCRALLIERSGFTISSNVIAAGKCPKCGQAIAGVWS